MTPETFCEQFATFAEAPNGVAKLRELILQLAVQGKLGTQDGNDEPASVLFNRVQDDRNADTKTKRRSASRTLPDVKPDEFPEVTPDGWKWIRLGQLADWAIGAGFPIAAQGHTDMPYLFVKVSDMNLPSNGKFIVTAQNTIDDQIAKEIGAKLHPAGTVVFPKIGGAIATNKRRILTRLTAIDNNCLGLTPIGLCDPDWLYLLLTSMDFAQYQSGTSVPALSQGTLELLVVSLPPLAEQRRIVGKVDQLLGLCDELAARQAARREARSALVGATLDRLVSASDRTSRHPACRGGSTAFALLGRVADSSSAKAVEPPGQARWRLMQEHAHRLRDHFDRLFDTPTTLPQLRQAILQLAVQGQLVPQDPNDEPVKQFLHANDQERLRRLESGTIRTKTSNDADTVKQSLDEVPDGWKRRPLIELSQFIDYRGKTPTRTPAGVRLITAKNVRMGSVENEPVEFVTEKQYEQWMTRGFPEIGDLLFVTEGHTMGFVGMLNLQFRFALAQRTINLHPFVKDFNKYLLFYLMSPRFQSDVVSNSTGSAAKGIKASKLKQLLIPVPPLSEQKRIVSKVTELLSLCDALEAKLTQAESASTQLLAAAVHYLLTQRS